MTFQNTFEMSGAIRILVLDIKCNYSPKMFVVSSAELLLVSLEDTRGKISQTWFFFFLASILNRTQRIPTKKEVGELQSRMLVSLQR